MVSSMVGVGVEAAKDCMIQNVYDRWSLGDGEMEALKSDTLKSGTLNKSQSHNTWDSSYQFTPSETPEVSLLYPILQPLTAKVRPTTGAGEGVHGVHMHSVQSNGSGNSGKSNSHSNSNSKGAVTADGSKDPADEKSHVKSTYLPWELNEGSIKFTLLEEHQSSFVEAAEESVVVRIKDICLKENKRAGSDAGYEMQGWYPVRQPRRTVKTVSSK
jgi:hypothetical protein